jgi:hypothetical protein
LIALQTVADDGSAIVAGQNRIGNSELIQWRQGLPLPPQVGSEGNSTGSKPERGAIAARIGGALDQAARVMHQGAGMPHDLLEGPHDFDVVPGVS